MHIDDFNRMSATEQREWSWNADEKRLEEIKSEFLRLYGHPKIDKIAIDNYGLGGQPCIYIELKPGKERLKLPKEFMWRIIMKRYLSTGKLSF